MKLINYQILFSLIVITFNSFASRVKEMPVYGVTLNFISGSPTCPGDSLTINFSATSDSIFNGDNRFELISGTDPNFSDAVVLNVIDANITIGIINNKFNI